MRIVLSIILQAKSLKKRVLFNENTKYRERKKKRKRGIESNRTFCGVLRKQ